MKKPKQGHSFIISYEVYPFDVLVSLNQTDDEVEKLLKKKLPDDQHDEIAIVFKNNSNARTVMFSGGQTFIRFNEHPGYGLIAHEVFHAVNYLFDRIGITLSDDSGEAWAYLIQYLMYNITNNIPLTINH
jgi:hypothetical protein